MKVMERGSKYEQYDIDGDGIVSDEELARVEELMRVEHERAQYENEDKKQDAQRNMAWFALFGMLLYPFAVVHADFINLDSASKILGDMAPTYFVSVAAIVAAFYAKEAFGK